MKKALFLVFVLIVSIGIPVSAQDDNLTTQLDTYLSRLENIGFSGSVMIVQNGEIILNEGYGLANATVNEPNTPDTIYPNGSITKLFTATAILQLHEAGRLDAEAPISDYLDNVPADKASITITQLLSHTGGLETYHDTEGDFQQMSRQEAYDTIMNTPLFAETGTEYNYSNSGYTLLAILIEEISGQSYQDYLRDHIFTPLNMNRSGFRGESFDNMAYSINTFDGYGTLADWDYSWVIIGNGGIVTTNADHALFIEALLNFELFSQETSIYWDDLSQIDLWRSTWIGVAGGGDAQDYNASIYFNLDADTYIYNMTNTDDFLAEFVSVRLGQIIQGETIPFPPELTDAELDADTCYIGFYQLPGGGIFTISNDTGNLRISAIGQSAVSALTGVTDPQLQEWYTELTAEADVLLTDVDDGDLSALANAFDVPVDELARYWLSLENAYGIFESYTIHGTTVSEFGENEPVTIVNLEFSATDLYLMLYWNEDSVPIDFILEETNELVFSPLYPTADETFTTFNLFLDTTVNISFVLDGNDVSTLQINSVNEEIQAQLVEQECL